MRQFFCVTLFSWTLGPNNEIDVIGIQFVVIYNYFASILGGLSSPVG